MSFIKHECSWPGCERKTGKPYTSTEIGRCTRHGKWYACSMHEMPEPSSNECPTCRWESPQIQFQLEADRRNAVVDTEMRNRLQGYLNEFRAQGYGEAAAAAMAQKKFSQDPKPPRWGVQGIASERNAAVVDQEWRTGKRLRCLVCKVIAPASDGILLQHVARHYGGKDDRDEYCDNYGVPGEPWEIGN